MTVLVIIQYYYSQERAYVYIIVSNLKCLKTRFATMSSTMVFLKNVNCQNILVCAENSPPGSDCIPTVDHAHYTFTNNIEYLILILSRSVLLFLNPLFFLSLRVQRIGEVVQGVPLPAAIALVRQGLGVGLGTQFGEDLEVGSVAQPETPSYPGVGAWKCTNMFLYG